MEERGMVIGLEKNGGGRKKDWGFVLYMFITAGA